MSIITESEPKSDSDVRDFHNESLSFYRSWEDDTFFEPMATQIENHTIQSRLTDVDFSAAESMVRTMENGIFRTRISNARRDFIEPLHESMGFYAEQNRKLVSLHHREVVSLLRSIDEKMTKIPEDTSTPILGGLRQTYFNFTRMPVWTTLKATYDFVLKPLTSGIKSLVFGSKSDKTVLKELQRQTELIRTGQIDQTRGFFQKIREDGLLGMGAKGLTRLLTAGSVSQQRSQDAANRKARGESLTIFDKLSLRFHKDIVLPDREKAMAMIDQKDEDDSDQLQPIIVETTVDFSEVSGILENMLREIALLRYSTSENALIEGEILKTIIGKIPTADSIVRSLMSFIPPMIRHQQSIIQGMDRKNEIIEAEFSRLVDSISTADSFTNDQKSVLDQSREAQYQKLAIESSRAMQKNLPIIAMNTELSAHAKKESESGGSGGGRRIGGIVGAILSAIPMIIGGLALLPMFKDIWDRIPMDEIKEIGSLILQSAWDGLKIIWDGMNTYLPMIYGAIGQWFRTEFPTVLSNILVWLVTDGIPAALRLAVSLAEMIGNMILGTVSGIFSAIGTLSSMATEAVGDMIGNAWDSVLSVTSHIGDSIVSMNETIISIFDSVTSWLGERIVEAWDTITRPIMDSYDFVVGIFSGFVSSLRDAARSVLPNRLANWIFGDGSDQPEPTEEQSNVSENGSGRADGSFREAIGGIWNRIENAVDSDSDLVSGIRTRIENFRGNVAGPSQQVNFDADAFRQEAIAQEQIGMNAAQTRTVVQEQDDSTNRQMLQVLTQLVNRMPDGSVPQIQIPTDTETLAASMGTL